MASLIPGTLLIAEPFLKDPNFLRSVVLLCEHGTDGSVGFILNRSYEQQLDQLVPEMSGSNWPLYYGGPVQTDTLHFIHQYPHLIPGSRKIREGIWWGGDFSTVMDLLKEETLDPSKLRFFVGYAGWDPAQLEEELQQKSWLTTVSSASVVFRDDPADTWTDVLLKMGGDYAMMVNYPIDPQLN